MNEAESTPTPASGTEVPNLPDPESMPDVEAAFEEIEVDSPAQLTEVLDHGGADVVMLDNFTPDDLRTAVGLVAGRLVTEASGGITPDAVRAVAETGVDLISVGWLTHSAPSLDVGLDL